MDRNKDNRSTSPPPIFRQLNPQNGIRIITDHHGSIATTNHRSAATATNQIRGNNESYKKTFTSLFLCSEIKLHSQKQKKEFSVPETWLSEHLSNCQPETCKCCLCKWRHRSGNKEICVKTHPYSEACSIDQESRPKNTMSKYQKRHVCDECMSALTLKTKKIKTKYYRCCFHPCSIQFKSITLLRKHYLDHLKVKNFICSICEKNYKSKSGLKMHERMH